MGTQFATLSMDEWIMLAIAVIAGIPYVILIFLRRRLKRFEKAHLALETFMSGNNLEDLLNRYLEEVEKIRKLIERDNERIGKIEEKLRKSVDRAELMRFNAFEDMGSDLSFAFALLNQEGDGVVITSINSREESRVYAKPVKDGKSPYHLSEEERKVIERARETKRV